MGTRTVHFCDGCGTEHEGGGGLMRISIKLQRGSQDPGLWDGDLCIHCLEQLELDITRNFTRTNERKS